MSWHPAAVYMDTMVKDYLTFRKLTATLKALESELKSEKDKGFKVDKVIQHLVHFVHGYDIEGLTSYWNYLKETFFNRCAKCHRIAVEKYEADLYRYYMVHCVQTSKVKELQVCLQKLTDIESSLPDLKDWYSLLFMNYSEMKSSFAPYFTRQWNETFIVSLNNFLSMVFSCMPEPDLVRTCADDGENIQKLEKENEKLKAAIHLDSVAGSIPLTQSSYSNVTYIQQLGRPASLVKPAKIKEASTKKGLSKILSMQSSPKARTGANSHGESTSTDNTSSSSSLIQQLSNTSTSRKHEKLNLNKKSASVDIVGTSSRKDITMPTSTPSAVPNLNNNFVEGVQTYGIASKLESGQHQSTPPEILYEQAIILGKKDTNPTGKTSPTKVKDTLPNLTNAFLTNAKQTTGSILPSVSPCPISTGSPLSYNHEPFIILSKDIFFEHHSSIVQCKFDNLGTTIASVDSQGVVKAWQNEPTIKSLATVMMLSPIQCLEWCTKPSDTLVLGTANGTIRFFDIGKNIAIKETVMDGVYQAVTNIRMHPNGNSFVSSSVRPFELKNPSPDVVGQLTVWDVQPSAISSFRKLSGSGSPSITCMDYNHNGNLLVTGDVKGCIFLFDLKTTAVIHSTQAHKGSVHSVEFSSDETYVFSIGTDNELMSWDIHNLTKQPAKFNFLNGLSQSSASQSQPLLVLSPDGNHALMSSGSKGLIYEINSSDKTSKHVLSLPEHNAPVTALDWISTKACGHCLTGSADGRIHVTTLLLEQ